jgi:peptide deformylase
VILKVARIGHPVVRTPAEAVSPADLRSPEIQHLIDDMVDTMHEYDGVGVAAPQVHVALRLAVIEVPGSDERAREAVPLTVLVNPVVTPLGDELQEGWEGCLSVPDLRGLVPRHRRLRLEALDRHGRPYVTEAADFFARVIQHECDHLLGSVYLDRMRDMRTLSFLQEFERFVVGPEDGEAASRSPATPGVPDDDSE